MEAEEVVASAKAAVEVKESMENAAAVGVVMVREAVVREAVVREAVVREAVVREIIAAVVAATAMPAAVARQSVVSAVNLRARHMHRKFGRISI